MASRDHLGLFHIPGSSRLAVLFEQWVSCSGHWTESSIYLQMKIERRHRTIGSRRWMTLHELSMKYGSRDVALKIQAAKESDPEYKRTQIRPHPDAPDDDVSCLLKVLVFSVIIQTLSELWEHMLTSHRCCHVTYLHASTCLPNPGQ